MSPGSVCAAERRDWVGRGSAWVGGICGGAFCAPPTPYSHPQETPGHGESLCTLEREVTWLPYKRPPESCPMALRKHRAPEGLDSKVLWVFCTFPTNCPKHTYSFICSFIHVFILILSPPTLSLTHTLAHSLARSRAGRGGPQGSERD